MLSLAPTHSLSLKHTHTHSLFLSLSHTHTLSLVFCASRISSRTYVKHKRCMTVGFMLHICSRGNPWSTTNQSVNSLWPTEWAVKQAIESTGPVVKFQTFEQLLWRCNCFHFIQTFRWEDFVFMYKCPCNNWTFLFCFSSKPAAQKTTLREKMSRGGFYKKPSISTVLAAFLFNIYTWDFLRTRRSFVVCTELLWASYQSVVARAKFYTAGVKLDTLNVVAE